MAIANPSFEDAGAAPGQAEHWTLRSVASLERIAGFGPDLYRVWEDFDRWFDLVLSLGPGDVAIAFFDPLAEGYEDFEEAWDNDLYLTELPSGQVITAPFGGGAVEDLEDGWDNTAYAWSWDDVGSVTGSFDGEPREDFEDQWAGNQSYAWSWGSVSSAAAMFDGGAQNREDFENDWTATTTI